jgi:hypothetical protein
VLFLANSPSTSAINLHRRPAGTSVLVSFSNLNDDMTVIPLEICEMARTMLYHPVVPQVTDHSEIEQILRNRSGVPPEI